MQYSKSHSQPNTGSGCIWVTDLSLGQVSAYSFPAYFLPPMTTGYIRNYINIFSSVAHFTVAGNCDVASGARRPPGNEPGGGGSLTILLTCNYIMYSHKLTHQLLGFKALHFVLLTKDVSLSFVDHVTVEQKNKNIIYRRKRE